MENWFNLVTDWEKTIHNKNEMDKMNMDTAPEPILLKDSAKQGTNDIARMINASTQYMTEAMATTKSLRTKWNR